MSDPVEARQVYAYNQGDIDVFLACYAREAVIEDAAGTVLTRGHASCAFVRRCSTPRPALRADITTRIRVGDYVIDEEAGHRAASSTQEPRVVVIYHLANNLIDHVRAHPLMGGSPLSVFTSDNIGRVPDGYIRQSTCGHARTRVTHR